MFIYALTLNRSTICFFKLSIGFSFVLTNNTEIRLSQVSGVATCRPCSELLVILLIAAVKLGYQAIVVEHCR